MFKFKLVSNYKQFMRITQFVSCVILYSFIDINNQYIIVFFLFLFMRVFFLITKIRYKLSLRPLKTIYLIFLTKKYVELKRCDY